MLLLNSPHSRVQSSVGLQTRRTSVQDRNNPPNPSKADDQRLSTPSKVQLVPANHQLAPRLKTIWNKTKKWAISHYKTWRERKTKTNLAFCGCVGHTFIVLFFILLFNWDLLFNSNVNVNTRNGAAFLWWPDTKQQTQCHITVKIVQRGRKPLQLIQLQFQLQDCRVPKERDSVWDNLPHGEKLLEKLFVLNSQLF